MSKIFDLRSALRPDEIRYVVYESADWHKHRERIHYPHVLLFGTWGNDECGCPLRTAYGAGIHMHGYDAVHRAAAYWDAEMSACESFSARMAAVSRVLAEMEAILNA